MAGSVAVKIAHNDRRVEYELLEPEDNTVSTGLSNEFTDGAELLFEGTFIQKGLDAGNIAEFVLQFGLSVTSGVIASWLYSKLKDKDIVSLRIGGEEVDVDEDSIQTKLDDYLN